MDLQVVTLRDGALSIEVATNKAIISTFKNMGLNLVVLPIELLHTLQAGVIAEINTREQRALSMINKYKVNNENMFVEKMTTLEAWKKVRVQNEQTTVLVAEACRTVPKPHISKESPVDAKVRKLAAGVHDIKIEVAKVRFEMNLKIIELDLMS